MGLGMALGDHKTTRFQRYSYVCLLANSHRYQERKKQVKVGGGGSGFQGHFFIKKGHLQVNSFTVAIQRNCL